MRAVPVCNIFLKTRLGATSDTGAKKAVRVGEAERLSILPHCHPEFVEGRSPACRARPLRALDYL